ncbi:hypothetical protein BH11PLA2_BH11PLA2_36310 [soil metagenome]
MKLTFPGVFALLMLPPTLRAADEVMIKPDVVYGHKDGMALTFDVLTPPKPNGAGVMYMVSGGWYSTWGEPKQLLPAMKPLTDKGFTVFIVRHGSAPKYTVPEAVADVRRCSRFIHLHSKDYGIEANRLGVFGGSAGGHLSLMLGTTGDDGDPQAKENLFKQSSRVAAVVAYYPPTDLRGWTNEPPEAIKKLPQLKPPLTFDEKLTAGVSPMLQATPDDAPSLMISGDKDELVPVMHSQNMVTAFEKAKVPCELLVIKGAGHGFSPKHNETVVPAMVGWFEKYLAKK